MSDQENLRERGTLSLDVDLNTIINATAHYSYDGEGNQEFDGYEGGITLGERAAELLAEKLFNQAQQVSRFAGNAARTEVEKLVKEQVSTIVEETLAEFVKTYVIPPSPYSRSEKPMSITELIVSVGEKWTTGTNDFGRRNNLQTAVDKAVTHTFTNELEATVKTAKAQIMSALQSHSKATVDAALLKLGVSA